MFILLSSTRSNGGLPWESKILSGNVCSKWIYRIVEAAELGVALAPVLDPAGAQGFYEP